MRPEYIQLPSRNVVGGSQREFNLGERRRQVVSGAAAAVDSAVIRQLTSNFPVNANSRSRFPHGCVLASLHHHGSCRRWLMA